MSIRRWIEFCALFAWATLVWADPCHDALARFDYPAAAQLAQARLQAEAGDLSARMCAARAAYETGHFNEALAMLRSVEAARPQAESRTYAYNWLTVTLRKLGRDAEAQQYGEAALAWARRERSQQNLATALHNLTGIADARGDTVRALALNR